MANNKNDTRPAAAISTPHTILGCIQPKFTTAILGNDSACEHVILMCNAKFKTSFPQKMSISVLDRMIP